MALVHVMLRVQGRSVGSTGEEYKGGVQSSSAGSTGEEYKGGVQGRSEEVCTGAAPGRSIAEEEYREE